MSLSPEEQLAFAVMKINPTPEEMALTDKLLGEISDWESLCGLLTDRGLAPLLYRKMDQLPSARLIPASIKQKLMQVYYLTFSRATLMNNAYHEMADAWTAAGITFLPLKGICLSETLYGDNGLRQFSDIDVLVSANDSERLRDILRQKGFQAQSDYFLSPKVQEEIVHHAPMVRAGIPVEVHEQLHSGFMFYSIDPEAFIRRAVKVLSGGKDILIPHPVDHLIFICTHLDRHFGQGAIQFTGYCDIVNLCDNREPAFWEELIERAEVYQCTHIVMKHILMAQKYMHLAVPAGITTKYAGSLQPSDEKLLLRYLHGYRGFTSGMPKHFGNLRIQQGFSKQLSYLMHALFPPLSFMQNKFQLKNKTIAFLYYPYRWWLGVKGVTGVIFSRKLR